MKLILTRHGETEENVAGILQGHLPGKLSARGIEQAKKVAVRLQQERIDFIYSSDLDRAAHTAKEIAQYHPKAQIEFVESLRERNLGEFQGRKKSELKDQKATFAEPKEGETMEEVFHRAAAFLREITHKHHDDSVLLVCHSGVGKALVAVVTGKSHTEIRSVGGLQNASISIFEIGADKDHKIVSYNCTEHLK